jgi:membrane-bound inhibitor of C-type lysozyme
VSGVSGVSDVDSGDLVGSVDGNANHAQQVATGSGASNQNNTLATKGNTGTISSSQSNSTVNIAFAPVNPR